jgi:F420-dependent oxidoreductase-like protein
MSDVALRVMLEPQQGASYEQMLAMALAAEAAGFDGIFRSDHLLTIGGPPRTALEAWTTLAALARDTHRARLGTLVSPITFRHPAVLARAAATVDWLSGGRVELGMGAGWFEPEHHSLGLELPPAAERMERLEEAVAVVRALLSGEPASFAGRHYQLHDAVALPPARQARLPLIIGGAGKSRSAQLAARHADEYNTTSVDPDGAARVFAAVRAACEQQGRDPATLRLSWMGTCLVAEDEQALRRRASAYGELQFMSGDGAAIVETLAGRGIVGTYATAAERMQNYVDAGCERLYLRILDLDDLELPLEITSEVASRLLPV